MMGKTRKCVKRISMMDETRRCEGKQGKQLS